MAEETTKTTGKSDDRPEITGTATSAAPGSSGPTTPPLAGSPLGSGDFAASDSAGEPGSTPDSRFGKVASEVRQGAERAREEIRRGAEATKHAATDAYDRASSAAGKAYARASEGARHGVDEARENLRHGYQRLREDSAGWSRDLESYVRVNPGRAVIFAAALGFVVGMLFRGDDE